MALPAPASDATVVVTGASAGIGTDLAKILSSRGHHVTLVARRRERLEALADELENDAAVEAADLGDRAGRDELLARLAGGRTIAGLCNNAGHGSGGRFAELDLEWEMSMVRLNVEALHHLTGAVLPGMVERGAGAVLNVASIAAFQPIPNMATYAATKAFVHSFSEAVHAELSGTGVSVTSLCPGLTRTEFPEAAGIEHAESRTPGMLWMSSHSVARQGIDAMEAGRRTVVPGIQNKLTSTSGRYAPRTVLLPITKRFGGGIFG